MTSNEYRAEFRVPSTHPSLPGHFPGHPLVPGVVLLTAVADALRQWRNMRLVRVIDVKFSAPLLPEEAAELTLSGAESRIRFDIRRDGQTLARGSVEAAE